MNKFDKYKIPIFISLNILVLISLFGMAYAYFKATVNNAESASTISVESGELTINYQGNTANIVASGIVPGWSETKKFTLSGKNTTKTNEFHTDNNLYYKIILAIDNNTFSEGALTYSLAKDSTSSTNGKMADEVSETINQSGNQVIGSGYFSETSTFVDHIYNLTISFPSTEYDQSADNGKSFAAHVTIGEGKQVKTTTFAEDSWETIAAAIKNGQLDSYPLGSEKEVEIDGTSYTVRVANNTTPDECNGEDFSQTACGFVVEFVDIVENKTTGLTDKDGKAYADSDIRTYLNKDFYNKLPTDLRKNIISTNVKSLFGTVNIPQYIQYQEVSSVDFVYLLSAAELTGKYVYISTFILSTRQLDYYSSKQYDSSSNQSIAIKQYDNNASSWLLRDRIIYRGIGYDLAIINNSGSTAFNTTLNNSYGIAPAFRIG